MRAPYRASIARSHALVCVSGATRERLVSRFPRTADRALRAKLKAEPKYQLVTKTVPSRQDEKSTVFVSDHPNLVAAIDPAMLSGTDPTATNPTETPPPETAPADRVVLAPLLNAKYDYLFVPEFMYPGAR